MNSKINSRHLIGLSFIICHLSFSMMLASCADFFEQDSEQVIFTDREHLNSATDTIYSVTGILSKLQVIADRTILLGEARADLVDVTNVTNADLRDIASFNIGDDNIYNQPRDYYAVINNCNYFVEHADTALRNNRNEYIFMREYAAVKAIRAWTYLQLVLNYGSVPFVTQPILTKQEAEADYPRYDLSAVCQYFINDLLPLADRYGREYPAYGDIRSNDSRFFWFPINIVLGDLNLWLASTTGSVSAYREAALRYYKYINERNGLNSFYAAGVNLLTWAPGTSDWESLYSWGNISEYTSERYSEQAELITMIPGDSIPAEGNYSQLRNIFNSTRDNDYKVSLTPSPQMIQISESQVHCCVNESGTAVLYAPQGLPDHLTGDLRFYRTYSEGYARDLATNERIKTQYIEKHSTRNVHIYRKQMIYLRLAEALNGAGYPRMAFQILSQGLNNDVLEEEVLPYVDANDSTFVTQFDFPRSRYGLFTVNHFTGGRTVGNINTMGLHTRGSGWTPLNEFYQLPTDSLLTEEQLRPIQQHYVDSLILNEEALELAFEGTRFYDLMRYALRQPNPGQTMANYVYARRGESNRSAMRSEIKKDIEDQRNWFLNWNGKIGF